MQPKDLLVDLESGDRTKEHLESKEQSIDPNVLAQLQALQAHGFNAGISGSPWIGYQNEQLSNLYGQRSAYASSTGLGLAQQMANVKPGGIIQW